MKISNAFILALFAIATLYGCEAALEERQLPRSNVTEYIYGVTSDSLRNLIKTIFKRSNELDYYDAALPPLDTMTIFDQPGNGSDVYLSYSNLFRFKGGKRSPKYPKNEYVAAFHLHLSVIDLEHTKISVFTINPRILVGKEFLPTGPHFVLKNRYVPVFRTTIEEYQILYDVGMALGMRMPPVNLPASR